MEWPRHDKLGDHLTQLRSSAMADPVFAEALAEADHGKDLINAGFEEDVKVAARVDCVGVVPVFRDGHIVAMDDSRSA